VDHGPVLRSVGKLLQSLFSASFPQQGWRQQDLLRCAADVISLNKLSTYRYCTGVGQKTNGGHRTDVVMWEVRKRMRHVLIKNIFRIFLFKGALGIKKILTVPTLVLLFRNDLFRIWMRPFNKLEL